MIFSKLYRRQIMVLIFIPILLISVNNFAQSINVGVLYSRNESDSIFWSSMNANWAQYGNIEVLIDYTTMMRDSITYDSLAHYNYDVIIIDNALSNFGNPIYSQAEISAISLFVQLGHGLIITGGTLRSNGQLEGLLGFWGIAGQAMYGTFTTDSIEILDHTNYLFNNISTYKTYYNNTLFYGGQDWANDGGKGHISDWEIRLIDEDASLVGMIWNYVSGELRGSPITILNKTNYRSAFCGHPPVSAQSVSDDYQFVYNMIVFTSGLVSAVEDYLNINGFYLLQNYPNPFNPSTEISWQVPAGSWQTLKIYDVLGNEVTTLVDEYKPVGSYEVEWNASNYPSGVYFYQLISAGFIETKKMVLLK